MVGAFPFIQHIRSFAVLEVLREDEFSPLKNAAGADKDTPATAKAALMDLNHRQLLSAGGIIVDADGRKLPLIPPRYIPPCTPTHLSPIELTLFYTPFSTQRQ